MDAYILGFWALAFLCTGLSYVLREQNGSKGSGSVSNPAHFALFQRSFLVVFLIMNAGDWLQGPYVYALYQSYGYGTDTIALLFVTGFLSSALIGTVIGAVADTLGRKKLALVYAVLYALACLTKLSPNFFVLMTGRLAAGVATSLLFSVFESWMVCEHNNRGFPTDLISQTFSLATWGNGLVAILSGVAANFVADAYGLVSPFLLAFVLFIIGGVLILYSWNENYGQEKSETWLSSLYTGLQACRRDVKILSLGVAVCLGSVLLIVETNTAESAALALPFGWIFGAYMVSVMIGSLLFGWLVTRSSAERIGRIVYFAAALSLLVPIVTHNSFIVFSSFIVFEICCGVHFPLIGTLRSRYIPEDSRSAVLNLVRVPLNLIVVVVLLKVGSMNLATVYSICAGLLALAGIFALNLPEPAMLIALAV